LIPGWSAIQRFLAAFFFAADFFLPPFLVAADLSECWTGLIPLLGMSLTSFSALEARASLPALSAQREKTL
jgi:hypothetical protein